MLIQETESFVFYLCPDYPMVPLASAIEVLSVFNEVLGYKKYDWMFASLDGKPVAAANLIASSVQLSLPELRKLLPTGKRPRSVMICSGIDVHLHANKSLFACLRECAGQKILVGGISTGTYLIASAGLLNGKHCVVHWEIMEKLRKEFPDLYILPDLYEIDGGFCTCA
ncbi:MAG: AraC family transcriptional regulator, partial [Pseudomonadota bacterium]